MSGLMMPPLSLREIRVKAAGVRRIFGQPEDGDLDIVSIFESLQKYGVTTEIVPQEQLRDKHGETFPLQVKILIREDVYDRACSGYGRDRLTIAHEIGHLFLHGGANISLARVEPNYQIPIFCDPEWQANAFAGELLAPFRFIQELSIPDIMSRYKVSESAAKVQKSRRL